MFTLFISFSLFTWLGFNQEQVRSTSKKEIRQDVLGTASGCAVVECAAQISEKIS